MKKIFLIAFVLITSLQSFAGWKSAMLRLRHEMGRSISVTIDGRKYNKIGRSLTVGDLNPGVHRVKIYKYNSNGYGYSTGILVYQGTINVRPGRIYYGTVSNNGLDIEENCCIDDYGHWNNNENWDYDDDMVNSNQSSGNSGHHGGHGNHQGGNNNQWNDNNDGQVGDNWNNNNQWNQNHQGNNYGDNSWGSYNGQMSEGRFNELITQIKKASFETSKESVAKQALKTNKINCNQLLRILNEFSFESTKLQFAKDAYRSVVDKNNYYLINDAFTFQSSKDDLLEFLDRIK